MVEKDVTLWGIHAGKTGDADHLFLKKGFVAIGWVKMGDLGILKPDRESFKAKVAETHPDAKPGAIPNYAGQMFRFVHEMKVGDIVVYPSKKDRHVHLGRIEGPYQHNPRLESRYPNLRPVKWLCSVARTEFSQDALNEIGSAMALFQVKNHADEFIAVLPEGSPLTQSVLTDRFLEVISDYETRWSRKLEASEQRIRDLEKKNDELRKALAAGTTLLDEITDEVLKQRVSRLRTAPLDTLMREAGVILEDRLRRIAGDSGRGLYGVKLVEHVLQGDGAKLVFSTHSGEQFGVLQLYRGAMQFIRNPPMHKLMDYPESTARLLIRLIDSLLQLLSEGERSGTVTLDVVRHMLTRIPISDGQIAVYRALYSVGDAGMTRAELVSATNRSARELSGVLGALGRRLNATEGLENLGGITAVLECRRDGGSWWYRMLPILREALEVEGLV